MNELNNYLNRWFKNPTERRLAIALSIVVTGVIAFNLITSIQGQWTNEMRELSSLQVDVRELGDEITARDRLNVNFKAARDISLPRDSTLAGTKYYGYLVDLAGRCGLTEVKVDSLPPIEEPNFGSRLMFTLQCKGSLENVAGLMSLLRETPLLHKLTRIHFTDYSPLSRDVRCSMNIEALSLADSTNSSVPAIEDESVATKSSLQNYFAEHDPFRRYEPPKPAPATTVAAVPVIDHLSKVNFVGLVERDGVRQAWFFDSLLRNESLLEPGNRLTIDDFDGELLSADAEQVQLKVGETVINIKLGQSLRDVMVATH